VAGGACGGVEKACVPLSDLAGVQQFARARACGCGRSKNVASTTMHRTLTDDELAGGVFGVVRRAVVSKGRAGIGRPTNSKWHARRTVPHPGPFQWGESGEQRLEATGYSTLPVLRLGGMAQADWLGAGEKGSWAGPFGGDSGLLGR